MYAKAKGFKTVPILKPDTRCMLPCMLFKPMEVFMPTSAKTKMARSRERLRAAGLRPVQFWVPDTRLASFVEDLRLQCLALNNDSAEEDALKFAQAAANQVEGWK